MQTALRGSPPHGARARGRRPDREPFENDAPYSLAAHSTFAAGGRRIAARSSPRCAPATRWPTSGSRRSTRSRSPCSKRAVATSVERLLDAEEALEVITQIAYTTFANLAANVAETPIDDAFMAAASV